MSIKSFDDAHDFFPAAKATSIGFFGTLRLIWLAFSDGRGAQHVYEELRAHGVPHDTAAKRAMAIVQPRT